MGITHAAHVNSALIARFKEQVGLPPKTAARLVRFERTQRRLDCRGQTSWADIAAESGYADQAHLVREFRDFTGTTPTGVRDSRSRRIAVPA